MEGWNILRWLQFTWDRGDDGGNDDDDVDDS